MRLSTFTWTSRSPFITWTRRRNSSQVGWPTPSSRRSISSSNSRVADSSHLMAICRHLAFDHQCRHNRPWAPTNNSHHRRLCLLHHQTSTTGDHLRRLCRKMAGMHHHRHHRVPSSGTPTSGVVLHQCNRCRRLEQCHHPWVTMDHRRRLQVTGTCRPQCRVQLLHPTSSSLRNSQHHNQISALAISKTTEADHPSTTI